MPVRPPNVIIVLTDDQGYADLGCTGNPWLRTPHIDAFHDDALRLTDFHVSPLCTPSRGAIMTGRHPLRNGAWATCWGRSILKASETTMADVFAASGYRTGMFGKWHLGDNYPYRPMDRGFQHVVAHKGGGVGQTPDFWGNNYFDDTYFHNGQAVPHSGYCTDIWFEEAVRFIESGVENDEPFFAYIATNAPHSPFLVEDRYKAPYQDNPDIPEPAFYGMIENIDENFGGLLKKLEALGIADNTLVVFMTDNGSAGGCVLGDGEYLAKGYNAGLRGMKASYYDGGHRAPCFIRWPNGNIGGGRDIGELTLHVDLLPTLIELCALTPSQSVAFDGMSLKPLIAGERETLPDRVQFLQYRQNTEPPEKWTNAVITRRWRLVHGTELYDIKADPEQRHDIAADHPEVVERLRKAHEAWWDDVAPCLDDYCPISLGSDNENPTRLDSMDVMGDVAWHQTHIVQAQKSTGRWCVNVERPGRYTFVLRRWPAEMSVAIDGAVSPEDVQTHIYAEPGDVAATIHPVRARLKLFDTEQTLPVATGQEEIAFEVNLERTGITQLDAWFVDKQGDERGAYYVYVTWSTPYSQLRLTLR